MRSNRWSQLLARRQHDVVLRRGGIAVVELRHAAHDLVGSAWVDLGEQLAAVGLAVADGEPAADDERRVAAVARACTSTSQDRRPARRADRRRRRRGGSRAGGRRCGAGAGAGGSTSAFQRVQRRLERGLVGRRCAAACRGAHPPSHLLEAVAVADLPVERHQRATRRAPGRRRPGTRQMSSSGVIALVISIGLGEELLRRDVRLVLAHEAHVDELVLDRVDEPRERLGHARRPDLDARGLVLLAAGERERLGVGGLVGVEVDADQVAGVVEVEEVDDQPDRAVVVARGDQAGDERAAACPRRRGRSRAARRPSGSRRRAARGPRSRCSCAGRR